MVVSSGVFGRTFICPPLIRARKNQQPSFYISGKSDGLNELYLLSNERLLGGLPGVCRPRPRYSVGAQKCQKFCDVVTVFILPVGYFFEPVALIRKKASP
jgi:hypothetical protein